MRSEHAELFNHDEWAEVYDADVADESNPIRTGYDATLAWVVEHCAAGPADAVADLGAGTGNLSIRFGPVGRLVCVDMSSEMLAVARGKLAGRHGVEFVVADLLEFVHGGGAEFDVIATTYAAHHLTDDEKVMFIGGARRRLRPGGRLVVGDLMAASREAVDGIKQKLGHPDVDELFADEFPWWVEEAVAALATAGFADVRTALLSDLSWALAATVE